MNEMYVSDVGKFGFVNPVFRIVILSRGKNRYNYPKEECIYKNGKQHGENNSGDIPTNVGGNALL